MQKNITTESHHFFLTDEFSQWYPSNFKNERGTWFNCAEQWMMYCKAELFGDTEVMKKILLTNNPDEIKQLGREVKNFDNEVWTYKAPTFVTLGNIMKFSQNPELWEILDKTEDKILVEAASYDKIWGIGLNAEDAVKINDASKWLGLNKLGEAVMETRGFLRNHPQLIVSLPLNEQKRFAFYDESGQKTIRLNNKELADNLNCTVDNLYNVLSNLEQDINLPYAPFVKKTMHAKSADLLKTLNAVQNNAKKNTF
jgi:ribA/ribD-fused uncharacterized protein